jgi:2-C-methyl-D-erythritol 4-phosphate cytidylyltransferase
MTNLPPAAVVIPASGIGKRMGVDIPKQYLTINNKTILEHTITAFLPLDYVSQIIVVIANNDEWASNIELLKHPKVKIVIGGKERGNSVYNGLCAIDAKIEWALVHDAARPNVESTDIEQLYNHSVKHDTSAILATPVRDTLKEVNAGNVSHTVDRSSMYHALTPQCARVDLLRNALAELMDSDGILDSRVTDEASALELTNQTVSIVKGNATNIKVTQAEDLALIEFYLKGKSTK